MNKGILGQKVGTTQIYDEQGNAVPVTVLQAGPCHVLQLRTLQRDGYEAVQMGFGDRSRDRAPRSQRGHVSSKLSSKRSQKRAAAGVETVPKADCEPQRFIREFRGTTDGYEVGQQVGVDILSDVKAVDVTGTSKGRGFSGVMKRHNFSGQRASHGVKKVHRHPGGSGCSAYPSRLFKGKKMAGQYGNARVTTRNLKVVIFDAEKNLLVVRGAVPGPNGVFVVIRETNKLGS
jgi:large subunit ribosomal protein L3